LLPGPGWHEVAMKCCTHLRGCSGVLRPLLFLLLTWVLPSWCLIQRRKDSDAQHDVAEEQMDNELLEHIIALAKQSKPAGQGKGVKIKEWNADSGAYLSDEVERTYEATKQRQQTGTGAEILSKPPGTDAHHPHAVNQQRPLAVKQHQQTGTRPETLGQRPGSPTQHPNDVEKVIPAEERRRPEPDAQSLDDVEKPLVVEHRQQTRTNAATLAEPPETEAYYSDDIEEPLVVKGRQQTWTYAENIGDHMQEDLEKPLGSPDESFDVPSKSADTTQNSVDWKQQSRTDAEALIKHLSGPKQDDIVFGMFEHGGSRRVKAALDAARSLGYDAYRIKQVLFGKHNSSQRQGTDQGRADAKVMVQHFKASDGNALNDFLVEIFTYGGSKRVRRAMIACKALGYNAARMSAMLDSKAVSTQLRKGEHEHKGHRTLAEFAKALASVRPDKKAAENALVHLVRVSKPAPGERQSAAARKASETEKKDQELQQAQQDSLALGKHLRSSDKTGMEDLLVEMYDNGGAQRVKAAEEYSNALGFDMHAYRGLLER